MASEDDHLEAEYEDRNGNPHGLGSPDWEENERPYKDPDPDDQVYYHYGDDPAEFIGDK